MESLTIFLSTFSGCFLSSVGLLLAAFSMSLKRLSRSEVVASSMKRERPAPVDTTRPRSFFCARSPKSLARLPVLPAGYTPPPPVAADCITAKRFIWVEALARQSRGSHDTRIENDITGTPVNMCMREDRETDRTRVCNLPSNIGRPPFPLSKAITKSEIKQRSVESSKPKSG